MRLSVQIVTTSSHKIYFVSEQLIIIIKIKLDTWVTLICGTNWPPDITERTNIEGNNYIYFIFDRFW